MPPHEPRPAGPVNYLRLSITDRCNLACFYCQPRHDWVKLPVEEILRYEEFLHLARVAAQAGIRKVRVTGGEPLVRRGVVDFLARLAQVPGLEEICLTTNGVRLAEMAADLFSAGVRHLNVSLDTLSPERYRELTGGGEVERVLAGLERALALGFSPIKVNCVALRGINDEEILDFAGLAREQPLQVRFIELMPTVTRDRWSEHFLPMAEVRRRLAPVEPLSPCTVEATAGPARIFRPAGFRGELGFISPLSDHCCPECNRLRLTAAGRLRPCLFAHRELDLKGPLRSGAPPEALVEIFREAMRLKSSLSLHSSPEAALPAPCMASIGG